MLVGGGEGLYLHPLEFILSWGRDFFSFTFTFNRFSHFSLLMLGSECVKVPPRPVTGLCNVASVQLWCEFQPGRIPGPELA